jgi:hypothetical protein
MDGVDERRASVLHAMYDGVTPAGTVGLEYGKQQPAATRIATLTIGLKMKSALRLFLRKVRYVNGKKLAENSDSASDDQANEYPQQSLDERTLERRSSIVVSMNEYMFRRLLVEDKVSRGVHEASFTQFVVNKKCCT